MAEEGQTGQGNTATGTQDGTTDASLKSSLLDEGSGQDTQPGGDAGAKDTKDTDTADDKGKPTEGAPESYAEFKLPEGMTLEADVLTEFTALAKEGNLSQEKAQKFVEYGAKLVQRTQQAYLEQGKKVVGEWEAQVKADAEVGGSKLAESRVYANAAIKAFGTPDLKQVLGDHGIVAHPEVFKFLVKVGKLASEDRSLPGAGQKGAGPNAGSRTPEERAAILYPSMQSN